MKKVLFIILIIVLIIRLDFILQNNTDLIPRDTHYYLEKDIDKSAKRDCSTFSISPTGNDVKENNVYITRTGKRYHNYGCEYLRHSCIEITLAQATKAGLTPCHVCRE